MSAFQPASITRQTPVEVGLLTINEARADLGYEPVEGGDVILVQASKLPLTLAGEIENNEIASDNEAS